MYAYSQMGYHVSDFFNHLLLEEPANDYYEMLLHHIAATIMLMC